MLRKNCCVMAMVVFLVAVLPSASAQFPSAPDVPHSAPSQPMTTKHVGALLGLIDHILTPAMVPNLNDDGSTLGIRKCPKDCYLVGGGQCLKKDPDAENRNC
ncbi:hypothetical protein O3G_MSEX013980 [Manduca sexta]|uniref:Uncharacterized protein n=1 Tax=Manduca sexta TaxID=7130 RepID=A0A922CXQ8_MANSE|nr:hypothetical protein O3G_MSEX013980 [Manduca sexta]